MCRADPRFDADDSTIFYNVYNPNDTSRESTSWCVTYQGTSTCLTPQPPSPHTHTHTSPLPSPHPPPHTHTLGGNFTVNLYTQHHPYSNSTRNVFDPNLGQHDDFAVVGPYIFAAVCVCVCVHVYDLSPWFLQASLFPRLPPQYLGGRESPVPYLVAAQAIYNFTLRL